MESDWLPEAQAAIDACKAFAAKLPGVCPANVYLFGSAIYKGGEQFDAETSDLDIAIVFTDEPDATDRFRRIAALAAEKARLELDLIPALRRTNCVEPAVSLLPLMPLEISANIHKSGSRRFFDRNNFLDLKTNELSLSLPTASSLAIPDDHRQAIELVQKIRNAYLAKGANGEGGLPNDYGNDPIPKPIARAAALLAPNTAEGEWYDTGIGLQLLAGAIERRQDESTELKELHKKIAVRRGVRGKKAPLDANDQLLIAEILYDLAAATLPSPVVTWEIRFATADTTAHRLNELIDKLRRLVPDAYFVSVHFGSILLRLRSSMRSYETVQQLSYLGVLGSFFGVDEAQLSDPDGALEHYSGERTSSLDRLASLIRGWVPSNPADGRATEEDFQKWISARLTDAEDAQNWLMGREVPFGMKAGRITFADFVIDLEVSEGRYERVAIELATLRQKSSFFKSVDFVLELPVPTVLVVIGEERRLERLRGDFERLRQLSGRIAVVEVPVQTMRPQ